MCLSNVGKKRNKFYFAIKLNTWIGFQKKNEMVSTAKMYMLKSVPKLKTNKSLKLLLVDMKANCSIPMRLEMA